MKNTNQMINKIRENEVEILLELYMWVDDKINNKNIYSVYYTLKTSNASNILTAQECNMDVRTLFRYKSKINRLRREILEFLEIFSVSILIDIPYNRK